MFEVSRKNLFVALAYSGKTMTAWAESIGSSKQCVHSVMTGQAKSARVTAAANKFINQQFKAIHKEYFQKRAQ